MILHTVKTSPLQTLALSDCLNMMTAEDTLLLMEDAVIASQAPHNGSEQLKHLSKQGRVMVLAADLDARGVKSNLGRLCSYADFVELVINHKSQMAW